MVFKGSGRMLSSKAMDEIYSFIVDSNYEHSLLSQLNDKSTEKELKQFKKDLPKISKSIDNQIAFLKEME